MNVTVLFTDGCMTIYQGVTCIKHKDGFIELYTTIYGERAIIIRDDIVAGVSSVIVNRGVKN